MDVVVGVVAMLFAAMGVAGLVRPGVIVGTFGGEAATPDMRNEVRAVYGGFGLATAAALVLALAGPGDLRGGLIVGVALANVGFVVGRLVSFAIERPPAFFPTVLFALIEAILAAALFLAA